MNDRPGSPRSPTPLQSGSGSLFLGKVLALLVVGLLIVLAVGLALVIALVVQRKVGLELRPLLLVWGALLMPTVLAWIAFVMVVHAITQNRYTTYALCLGVLCFTGYRAVTNQINWVGNWPLWRATRWSDISLLELDRRAFVLSRVFAAGMAALLVVLTLALFRRREWDPIGFMPGWLRGHSRSRRSGKCRGWPCRSWRASTWRSGELGPRRGTAKKQEKDYWRKNTATYRGAKTPDPRHVELNLDLFPDRNGYKIAGNYDLINASDQPLPEILLTAGPHWEKLSWTMDDKPSTPKNGAGLFIFTQTECLAPGEKVRIGFRTREPIREESASGAAAQSEFILPSVGRPHQLYPEHRANTGLHRRSRH